jgi:hypothetical protein
MINPPSFNFKAWLEIGNMPGIGEEGIRYRMRRAGGPEPLTKDAICGCVHRHHRDRARLDN